MLENMNNNDDPSVSAALQKLYSRGYRQTGVPAPAEVMFVIIHFVLQQEQNLSSERFRHPRRAQYAHLSSRALLLRSGLLVSDTSTYEVL